MPTYTYQCQKCHAPTDVFHAMSATPKVKCPSCGSARMKRQLGTGAGIIFKGSGFYETDYKSKTGSDAKGESGAKTDSKGDGKAETKPKTDSKAESKSSKPAADKPKAKKVD